MGEDTNFKIKFTSVGGVINGSGSCGDLEPSGVTTLLRHIYSICVNKAHSKENPEVPSILQIAVMHSVLSL